MFTMAKIKDTHTATGGISKSNYLEHHFKESQLMKLRRFHCIVKHCEGKFIKTKLSPVDARNKRPRYSSIFARIFG